MDKKTLAFIRERTDAKLRYAEVHLDELKQIPIIGGSDFDRAHEESFLYHLICAKDAFILKLNIYYGANLPERDLTGGKLRAFMKGVDKPYTELTYIFSLENDESSWLSQAKEIRDHSTHVGNVPRAYHLGGEHHQHVHLKNSKTGVQIKQHFVDLFSDWLSSMKTLMEELRTTAIQNLSS